MATTATWRDHLHHWLRPVLGLCLFVAALVALDLQLKQHSLGEVLAQTRAIPAAAPAAGPAVYRRQLPGNDRL